jgi:XapX domain-containing protein
MKQGDIDILKITAGLVVGVLIGAGCRWFDIPLPGPPKIVGALLVVAVTLGYAATHKLIATRFSTKGPASTAEMCDGPTADVLTASGTPD